MEPFPSNESNKGLEAASPDRIEAFKSKILEEMRRPFSGDVPGTSFYDDGTGGELRRAVFNVDCDSIHIRYSADPSLTEIYDAATGNVLPDATMSIELVTQQFPAFGLADPEIRETCTQLVLAESSDGPRMTSRTFGVQRIDSEFENPDPLIAKAFAKRIKEAQDSEDLYTNQIVPNYDAALHDETAAGLNIVTTADLDQILGWLGLDRLTTSTN